MISLLINLLIKFASLQTVFSTTNLNNRFILQTSEVKTIFNLAISLSQFNFTIQEDVKLSNLT